MAATIETTPIQIDENVPRFGPLARPNDTSILQFIHHTSGTPVAQFEPPLKQGNTCLLLRADDLNALLKELIILAAPLVVGIKRHRSQATLSLLQSLMNLGLVARFALHADVTHHRFNLGVSNQSPLSPNQSSGSGG